MRRDPYGYNRTQLPGANLSFFFLTSNSLEIVLGGGFCVRGMHVRGEFDQAHPLRVCTWLLKYGHTGQYVCVTWGRGVKFHGYVVKFGGWKWRFAQKDVN